MALPAQRQVLVGATALLAILVCFGWGLACALNWSLRTADPFGPAYTSERPTQNTVVVVIVSAMLILNIVATLAFILRSRFGLPLLALVQVANVVATTVLVNLQTSVGWSLSLELSAGPAVTLLLLVVLWRARPQQSARPPL